jgi:UPF0755 protein
MTKTKNTNFWKIVGAVCLVGACIAGYVAYTYYKGFFKSNVNDKQTHLLIHTGWDFEQLMQALGEQQILEDTSTFRWAAQKMEYPGRIKPGRYKLDPGMNNRTLINRLGGGFQDPVKLRFDNLRLKDQLAGLLAQQLEPDSLAFLDQLSDPAIAQQYGFQPETFFSMFIPNTYEVYWNTTVENFLDRMHKEYQRFWTEERLAQAEALGLTPQEVSTLASIVKGEALHTDEMPAIAGLYLNRLKKGMLLQADPTVIFANQDFSIRRVLFKHLRYDSPYNTYIYKGLPPGPIMMPSIAAIDAVLKPQQHNYIYMCAKDDFSGYHNFAVTAAEHAVNARKFQQALNARNIR